ncbi:hypothetical protein PTKIN_Ptkin09bG0101200 [Pterospermum kingtungense]
MSSFSQEDVVALSQEEFDILQRSTKKKKRDERSTAVSNEVVMETNEESQAKNLLGSQGLSFRDTLMRQTNVDNNMEDEGFLSDDDDDLCEDDEEDCPTIYLLKEEKARIRRPWRMTSLWKPKPLIELLALENDYFLVKFTSLDDYEFAKYEGPCMIMDHYLIDFCMKVREKIRRFVRVNEATSLISRGKFARLCVEVDITKPLLARFKLRRRIRRIEYEGIHLVCFHCSVYGHRKDIRTSYLAETRRANQDSNGDVPEEKDEQARKVDEVRKEVDIRLKIMENYRPWILANRKSRNGDRGEKTRKAQGQCLGIKKLPILVWLIMGADTLRRPNVQINEKDLFHNKVAPNKTIIVKGGTSTRVPSKTSVLPNKPKQAAGEEEHVVVRGSGDGKSIVREVVHTNPVYEAAKNNSLPYQMEFGEQHKDPLDIPVLDKSVDDIMIVEKNGENRVLPASCSNVGDVVGYIDGVCQS